MLSAAHPTAAIGLALSTAAISTTFWMGVQYAGAYSVSCSFTTGRVENLTKNRVSLLLRPLHLIARENRRLVRSDTDLCDWGLGLRAGAGLNRLRGRRLSRGTLGHVAALPIAPGVAEAVNDCTSWSGGPDLRLKPGRRRYQASASQCDLGGEYADNPGCGLLTSEQSICSSRVSKANPYGSWNYGLWRAMSLGECRGRHIGRMRRRIEGGVASWPAQTTLQPITGSTSPTTGVRLA